MLRLARASSVGLRNSRGGGRSALLFSGEEAELWVDHVRREPVWRGAYADAGQLGAEQLVVLRYPLRLETEPLELGR